VVEGVLLDIDGVLTVSWEPLPGATHTIDWLREHEIGFRLVTNTSSRSRDEIAELLSAAGMAVGVEQIDTAVTSAATHLAEHHRSVGCYVVNDGGDLAEDLTGVEVAAAADAGVVLLGGAGPDVGYDQLNAAFRLADASAPVVALHRNTRFQTADGPALDMGAFLVGLETATGCVTTVVGKPAAAFFHAALAGLGVEAADAVMVGDDIGSDVLGAQAVGLTGVLVRTGKFRPADLDSADPPPDHVIDGVGELPALLQKLNGA